MKKTYLKSFCARCLTLLVLALLSTNLAWGATVSGTFTKITSLSDLTTGQYVIVGAQKAAGLGKLTYGTLNSGRIPYTQEYTSAPVSITNPAGASVWDVTVSETGTSVTLYNAENDKYIAYANDGKLKYETSGMSFTAAYSDGVFSLTSGSYYLCVNTTANYWRNYASGTGYNKGVCLYFYKKQADVPVTGVTLNTNTLSLNVGATETLTATVAPDNATNKNVTWSSNEESVATVSESGVVIAVAAGTATITATSVADETISASCVVTVSLNKLAAPANLAATNIASTSATLTWGEVANASSYEVNINNKTLTAETNSLLVGELTASTAYTWTVKAKGDNTTYEDSELSAESNFTTLAPPSVAYTVTFDGNGHGTPASESITETEPAAGVTLPDCTPNTGYQFVGWATTETATEAEYEAGDPYYPIANITLYAVYNEVYTINYMVNGVNTDAQENVVKGTALVFPEVTAPDADHVFCGWVTEAINEPQAEEPEYVNTTGLTATEDATYYAVFAEKEEGTPTKVSASATFNGSSTGGNSCTSGYTLTLTKTTNKEGYIQDDAKADEQTIIKMQSTTAMFSSTPSKVTVKAKLGGGSTKDDLTETSQVYAALVDNAGNIINETQTVLTKKITATNGSDFSVNIPVTNIESAYGVAIYHTKLSGYNVRYFSLEVNCEKSNITYSNYCTTFVTKELSSISLSGEYPTVFWKGDAFSHEGMTVTAHYSNADDEDVTNKATFSTPDMTEAGEQTVTVTYEGKTATYNITVKTIANTEEDAYTVAEAKTIIDAGKDLGTEVYVKGTVSKVDEYNSTYHSITYWLDNNAFEVYSGKNLNNTNFASKDDVKVGDDVIIYGKIKKFNNSTYEFDAGNYLVSHVKAATLSIDNITVSLGKEITPEITTNVPEAERTITYSVASEDVVKVEGGNLVTVAVGGPVEVTATLTAEGYKSAETTFTVEVIKALESIAVKTAPTTVEYKEGDKFDPTGLVITANYNDESTEDVAYAGNKDKFTFDPSLETALTTENTSVTITYAGKEATQAITVRALYTYDITWMANGKEFAKTQVTEGDALALPGTSPANVGDMKFMGWIAAESYYDASEEPEYIVPAEIKPEGAMTFYAVFAKEVEVEGPKTYSLLPDDFNGSSYSSNDGDNDINGITLNIKDVYKHESSIQMKASSGSLYNKYALGTKITSVVVDVKTNSVKVYEGSANNSWEEVTGSNGTYTFSDNKAYFKVTSTSSFAQVNSITVNYIGKTTSYSNYRTTIAPRTFTKTISNRKMATLYLDYAVTIPTDVKAYTAADKGDHTAITLEKITDGVIPANTGVIIYSDIATDYTFTETTDAGSTYENNCLKGVTEKTAFNAVADYDDTKNNYYALMADGETSVVFKLVSGGSYAANSAYLVLPKTAKAKVDFTFDDEPTGIESLQPSTLNPQPSQYNLNGMKVNSNYKGIVIMNGKKYINK